MSIFNIAAQNSFVDIEDESGQPIGLKIELKPLSSPDIQAIVRRHRTETTEAVRKSRDMGALQTRQAAELLSSAIVGWTWSESPKITTPKGKVIPLSPVPCTPENAKALMGDKQFPWIARQVDEHLGTESNFYAG